jgi:hypothetical protein
LKQHLGAGKLIFQRRAFDANVTTDRAIAAYSNPAEQFCQEKL